MTGGADPVILDTRIQGRIRVHTRTRGHDLWEPLNITDVWEYISKSPWCKESLSIIDSHTLSLREITGIRRHHNIELQPRPRDCISRLAILSIQPCPGQSPSLQWINQTSTRTHHTEVFYSSRVFLRDQNWTSARTITLRFLLKSSFPQGPELDISQNTSHWGFLLKSRVFLRDQLSDTSHQETDFVNGETC